MAGRAVPLRLAQLPVRVMEPHYQHLNASGGKRYRWKKSCRIIIQSSKDSWPSHCGMRRATRSRTERGTSFCDYPPSNSKNSVRMSSMSYCEGKALRGSREMDLARCPSICSQKRISIQSGTKPGKSLLHYLLLGSRI